MEQLILSFHRCIHRYRFLLLSLSVGIILAGCAGGPPRPPKEEISLKSLCHLYDIDWQMDSVSQVITLNKQGVLAKTLVGSSVVMVNDQKVTLSGPIQRSKDQVLVPADFKRRVIEELLKKTEFFVRRFRSVMIDPGHGGKDPGAINRQGLEEKTITLDIAKRLKQNLEKKGIGVTLTRSQDNFVSLEERAQLACKDKADLFVSIHVNAAQTKTANGFEVYYLKDMDQLKWYREVEKGAKDLLSHFAMTKNSSSLDKIVLDMLYIHKQAESKQLASRVGDVTARDLSTENRGAKSCEFFVLKNTLVPAILVEVGFISHSKEGALLKSGEYRQKIADGLAKSILGYVGH